MPRCLDDRGPAAGDTLVEADRHLPDDPEQFGTPAFLEEAGALRDADLPRDPRDPHEALAVVAVEGRGQGGARGHRSGSIRAVTADGGGGTARRDGRPDGPGPPLVRPPLAVPFGGTPGAVDPSVPPAGPGRQGPSAPAWAVRPWFAPGAQPAPVPWPPRTATARGRSPTGSRVTRPVATSTALRPFQ
ncbi:hypothetical protein GCM10010310_01520 [Streptomyces violaceolatus]|uniref:Uncharacterized protein n=1 Tax=Streptomyces violaceolatus TaxID=67378 RepID=A0ABN3S2N8_9ACTN